MDTTTRTVMDFLRARLDEDETTARRSKADDAMNPNLRIPAGWVGGVADRMLREVEAKRAILELAWHNFGDDDYAWGMEEAKRQVLVLMAAVYADHPDYDPSWS